MSRPLVIVESPYFSLTHEGVEQNLIYARAAVADCIHRGERPFASHLFYTQEGVLDDNKPDERLMGIELGYEFWQPGALIVFYIDRGWSRGMQKAFDRAERFGYEWQKRCDLNRKP